MNTRSSQKTALNISAAKVLLHLAEIIILMSIGAIGVLLHAKFRVPLKMPGHYGLIFMALIAGGRLLSKKPYASSLSSIGAATMLLVPLGFTDPFMPLFYLLPGFITDIGYRVLGAKRQRMLVLALICGLAYMTIPLSRVVVSTITGFPYGSFLQGFLWPILSHLLFGFAGGLAGAGLVRAFRKPSG